MEDERAEAIVKIFEDAGMTIDLGANFSVKGQIAQLLNGSEALVEQCAKVVESQDRGAKYEWVTGSFWEAMTKKFAVMIRRLNT